MTKLDLAAQLAGISDDKTPEGGVLILAYLDHEGDRMYATQTIGDLPYSTMIGLMFMAMQSLAHLADE